MPAYRTVDDIFLGDVEFWRRPIPERHEAFAALREETRRGGGMCFHEEVTVMGGDSAGPGYWSAVTYDDVQAVSRNPQSFSSASGVISNDPARSTWRSGRSRHGRPAAHQDPSPGAEGVHSPNARRGGGVGAGTGRAPRRRRPETGGSCDFVEAFAAPLPLQVICDMSAFPKRRAAVFQWTNVLLGVGDPELVTVIDDLKASAMAFLRVRHPPGLRAGDNPGDDLSSRAHAGGGRGERLNPFEFAAFVVLRPSPE